MSYSGRVIVPLLPSGNASDDAATGADNSDNDNDDISNGGTHSLAAGVVVVQALVYFNFHGIHHVWKFDHSYELFMIRNNTETLYSVQCDQIKK